MPWAKDEDELLLRMVQAEGDANWVRVSAKIEGRTPESVSYTHLTLPTILLV